MLNRTKMAAGYEVTEQNLMYDLLEGHHGHLEGSMNQAPEEEEEMEALFLSLMQHMEEPEAA